MPKEWLHPRSPTRKEILETVVDSETWRNPMRLTEEVIDRFPETEPKRRDRHGDGLAQVTLRTKGLFT